jgi:hypothetical protein
MAEHSPLFRVVLHFLLKKQKSGFGPSILEGHAFGGKLKSPRDEPILQTAKTL